MVLRDCPELPMRLLCIAFTSLLLSLGAPYSALGTQEAQTRDVQAKNVDVILVVDLSKSMRGYGDAANIFDRVEATAKNLVRELDEGDTMTLIPFGDAARALPTVTMYGDTERRRLLERIDELEANQSWTYTAEALKMSLQEASRLKNTFSDHRQVVFIFTDGRNNPPPGAPDGYNLDIAQLVEQPPSEPWYVYQVQYGDQVDQSLDSLITDYEFLEGETIQDENAQGGIDSIRGKVDRARSFTWSASPSSVSVKLSSLNDTANASIQFNVPEGIGARTLKATLNRSEIPEEVVLDYEIVARPENRTALNLTARATRPLEDGEHAGSIRIPPPSTEEAPKVSPLEVPLTVRTRAFKWSASPSSVSIELESPDDTASVSVQFNLPEGIGTRSLETTLNRSEIPQGIALDREIVSRPENRAVINLTARATQSIENGKHTGTVQVLPSDVAEDIEASPLEIPLTVETTMAISSWLLWLLGIGGGLLLLGGGLFGYKAWQDRQLYGRLEYWPSDDPDSVRSNQLDQFGMSATIGSDIYLSGEDELGTLSVENVDSDRLVVVTPHSEVQLRHDGSPESKLPLYNHRTFELGEWTFRYEGATPTPPLT